MVDRGMLYTKKAVIISAKAGVSMKKALVYNIGEYLVLMYMHFVVKQYNIKT
jgi:hypothetical protein